MNSKRSSTRAVLLLTAVAAAACGSDSTEPEDVVLNQAAGIEIASTLMSEIITIGFSALSGVGGPGGATAGASADVAATSSFVPITQTVPCQGGGSIAVQGNYTNSITNAGTGSVAFDLSQRPTNCVMSTSQGAYTVNGNPEFVVAGTLTVSQWTLGIFTIDYHGGFRWSGPGGSGSCTIELDYDFNYAASTYTASGHMCGYPINFSYTG